MHLDTGELPDLVLDDPYIRCMRLLDGSDPLLDLLPQFFDIFGLVALHIAVQKVYIVRHKDLEIGRVDDHEGALLECWVY
jgi:hypothetical protein